jgi:osmotically-inducible protein OsmY
MLSANRIMRVSIALRKVVVVIAALVLAVACRQQEVDYRAADVRLAQAVQAQLDASVDTKGAASRVVIEAKDGTVTLTGSVDTPQDKALLEQTVGRTNGVKSVVNQVTVNMPVLPVPDEPFEEQAVRKEADSNGERIGRSSEDARIYQAIRRQLVRHETTPKRAIFVDVEDGDVTLRGTIFTGAARDDAVTSAKKVQGVKALRDLLVINTQLP